MQATLGKFDNSSVAQSLDTCKQIYALESPGVTVKALSRLCPRQSSVTLAEVHVCLIFKTSGLVIFLFGILVLYWSSKIGKEKKKKFSMNTVLFWKVLIKKVTWMHSANLLRDVYYNNKRLAKTSCGQT